MTRNRLKKAERKKQIQKAASELFLIKGFKGTTMNEIRMATGLSAGGLYYHYHDTSEILYDIMVDGNKNRERIIFQFVEATGNKISAALLAEMVVDKIISDNPLIPLYVIFLCELKDNQKMMALYEKLKDESIDHFTRFIMHLGYIPPTPEAFDFLTYLVNSSLLGCEILGCRENFVKNKKNLILMLETYFSNIKKMKGEK